MLSENSCTQDSDQASYVTVRPVLFSGSDFGTEAYYIQNADFCLVDLLQTDYEDGRSQGGLDLRKIPVQGIYTKP